MKKFLAICLVISLALSMAACQATPEKNIVQGKSIDKMIEDATKTQAPGSCSAQSSSAQSGTQGGSIADKMGVPKTFSDELTDGTGKVKIHVNADVEVPDATGVTVQRVTRADFTQGQVDVLVKNLMHGDLFSGDVYKLSKSEIQQQILAVQSEMARKGETPSSTSKPDSKNPKGDMLPYKLSELQEQIKTAPDTTTKTPSSGKLETMDQSEGNGTKLYALAQSDKGYESLDICNDAGSSVNYLHYTSEKNSFSRYVGYYYTKDEIAQNEALGHAELTSQDIAQMADVKITEDQAKQTAEDLIKDLGLENMVCYSADKAYGGSGDKTADQTEYLNPRKCVWLLRYERSVNGVPITYTTWDCMKVEKDSQAAPWSYEDMLFAIDDSGIVDLSWDSPYKITDTVTQNSNVLSFSDVTKVFNTMSVVQNAWDGYADGNPDLTGIDITIDHVKFGLTRITEQNKRDSGLLVPVWDFFGTVDYISQKNGQTQTMPDGPDPVLTVNAIDGSIINRSLGY